MWPQLSVSFGPSRKARALWKEVIWGELNDRTSHKGVGRIKGNNRDGGAPPPPLGPKVGGEKLLSDVGSISCWSRLPYRSWDLREKVKGHRPESQHGALQGIDSPVAFSSDPLIFHWCPFQAEASQKSKGTSACCCSCQRPAMEGSEQEERKREEETGRGGKYPAHAFHFFFLIETVIIISQNNGHFNVEQ